MATRRRRRSVEDAQAAIDRLAAVPTHPGFVLHEIALLQLRALLAPAHGEPPLETTGTATEPWRYRLDLKDRSSGPRR